MSISAKFAAVAVLGLSLTAGSAFAQQDGLVNLNVEGNTVQVPVAVAAQVCGVSVDALAIDDSNTVTGCDDVDADSPALSGFMDRPEGGNANAPGQTQSGLVNLNVEGNTVQVPVAIAAQVCGVSVDALAIDDSNTVTGCDDVDADSAALSGFMNRPEGTGQANAPGQQKKTN